MTGHWETIPAERTSRTPVVQQHAPTAECDGFHGRCPVSAERDKAALELDTAELRALVAEILADYAKHAIYDHTPALTAQFAEWRQRAGLEPPATASGMKGAGEMISRDLVVEVDEILDANVSDVYKQQPLAQDWARISKETEEKGESIAELILATGQNPRKPRDPAAYKRLLKELADRALTGIYALQHFTKDIEVTAQVLAETQERHASRLREAAASSAEPCGEIGKPS